MKQVSGLRRIETAINERESDEGFDDSLYLADEGERFPSEEWQLRQANAAPPSGWCVHCGGHFRPRVERQGKPILCEGCNRQADRENWTWQEMYKATIRASEIAADPDKYRHLPFAEMVSQHAKRLVEDGRGDFSFAWHGALPKATLWINDNSTATYRD